MTHIFVDIHTILMFIDNHVSILFRFNVEYLHHIKYCTTYLMILVVSLATLQLHGINNSYDIHAVT